MLSALSSDEEEKRFFESNSFVNNLLLWLFFQVEEGLTGILLLLYEFIYFWLDDTTPADKARPVNKSCDQVEEETVLHEFLSRDKLVEEAEDHILILFTLTILEI